MQCDLRKVAIIGGGHVGITAAYALLLTHTVDELILVSRSLEKLEGEKLDLEHGLSFLEATKVTATTDYAALQNADVVIITSGVAQKSGQSRMDLVEENKAILAEMAQQILPYVQNSVVVVVSNPVDVLTFHLAKALGLPEGRVFGTGTMLDTARFRFHLSEFLHLNPRSIHAYILGEHGESAFPALESASVGGQPLSEFPHYSKEQALESFTKTREAAASIIKAKGATYYAIGVVISQVVRTILLDQRSVLPVTIPIENYYGESEVAVSVPCIVGRNGVQQILRVNLSSEEQEQFKKSCGIVRSFI